MKTLLFLCLAVLSTPLFAAEVDYEVDGRAYLGYHVSPEGGAPLVLLIHDWDGLTDYEMTTYGGAPHAFTVFDTDRHDPTADQRSWDRFIDFLDTLFGE